MTSWKPPSFACGLGAALATASGEVVATTSQEEPVPFAGVRVTDASMYRLHERNLLCTFSVDSMT
jgi:hypothetical protein